MGACVNFGYGLPGRLPNKKSVRRFDAFLESGQQYRTDGFWVRIDFAADVSAAAERTEIASRRAPGLTERRKHCARFFKVVHKMHRADKRDMPGLQ